MCYYCKIPTKNDQSLFLLIQLIPFLFIEQIEVKIYTLINWIIRNLLPKHTKKVQYIVATYLINS